MKLACFPFVPEVEVMLRHQNLMSRDSINSIISFHEDSEVLNKFQVQTGLLCTVSVSEGLENVDGLLLVDSDREYELDKYYECIDKAEARKIPVYASKRLIDRFSDEGRKKHIIRYGNPHTITNKYLDRRLFEIETPLVAIMGMGENCGKFECQLELKEQLDSLGYHSEWLGSNSLGEFMGIKPLPDFLFDTTMSFPNKVLELNKYVFDLSATYKPDIIVLSAPSGIVPFTEKDTNYFAEIPLIISSALQIDYGIAAFYYHIEAHDGFLQRISQYLLHRYQIRVPIFYMARQMMAREQEGYRVQQLFLSDDYMMHQLSDLCLEDNVAAPLKDNTPVFQSLISCLQGNLKTV